MLPPDQMRLLRFAFDDEFVFAVWERSGTGQISHLRQLHFHNLNRLIVANNLLRNASDGLLPELDMFGKIRLSKLQWPVSIVHNEVREDYSLIEQSTQLFEYRENIE